MDKYDVERVHESVMNDQKSLHTSIQRPLYVEQRRTATAISDIPNTRSNKNSPYKEEYTPEKGTRTGTVNTNMHTRSATDVSGSDKKGVIFPHPTFSSKMIEPKQTYMERHTDLGKWNSAKDVAKVMSELHVAEIENKELKEQYDKLRKEKIEAERTNKELERDNKEMSGKIVEQVEWIQGQMERNHNLSILLKNAKSFFGTYNKKLWIANQEFKELAKYILTEKESIKKNTNCSCNCTNEFYTSLDRIGTKLGTLIKSTEGTPEDNPQNYIDKLLQELSKESETRPNKKRTTSGLISKPKQDPFKEMRVKIEELKDEIKFGSKWKSMYMELLTDKNTPLPLLEELENELLLEKELATINIESEYEKAKAIEALKKEVEELKEETVKSKTIAINKETSVESLKRELRAAKDDARRLQEQDKQMKEQIKALRDEEKLLMEQIRSIREQNTSLKEQAGCLMEQVKSLRSEIEELRANEAKDHLRLKSENSMLKLRVTELEAGTTMPSKEDIDNAISKLSSVLKNDGSTLGEREITILKKLLDSNAIELLQGDNSEYKNDCKTLLTFLNELVRFKLKK